jgi:hypothetical protein
LGDAGSDAITINGNTTMTGSTTLTTGTGLTTVNGGADIVGAFATRAGTTFTTPGTTHDAILATASYVRLDTSGAAQTLTGITGGADGRLLTLTNADTSNSVTLTNDDAASTAANRIITGTGASLTIASGASVNLIYDATDSRWRVVGGTGGSSSSFSSLDIANDPDGGAIGTAAGTVDTYTNFNLNQTTTDQTMTIPSPTNTTTTKGKIITINNVGTANFTIGGVTVPVGTYGSAFVWTGTTWSPLNAASNVAASYLRATRNSVQTTSLAVGNPVIFNTTSNSFGNDITLNTSTGIFTLKAGKTYRLTGSVNQNATGYSLVQWRDLTNNTLFGNLAATSPQNVNGADTVGGNFAEGIITPATDINVQLENRYPSGNIGFSNVDGFRAPWAFIEVIAGNAPVTGQTVDYVYTRLLTTTAVATNIDIPFATQSGNIPVSSGVFSLIAGKTYHLEANLMLNTSSSYAVYSWVDATTNTPLSNMNSGIAVSANQPIPESTSMAVGVYTPTTNQTVKVRTGGTGGTGNFIGFSHARVTQIGTTASTGVAMNTLTSAIANGSLDNTSYAQTWNWSTLTAGTSGLTLANTVGGTTQNNVLTISGGNNTGVNGSLLIKFTRPDGTVIGSVSQNAANTVAFNTTSDERLKQDISDTELGLTTILAIKVRDYSYISDPTGEKMTGFLAQELEQVFPGAVTIGTDEVDENGNLVNPWQVDYGKLTPLLVKSIQDINTKHEEFASQVGAQIEAVTDNGAISGDATVTGLSLEFGSNTTLASAMNFLSTRVIELDNRVTALEQVDPTVTNVTNTTEQVTQEITNITQVIEDTKQYGIAKIQAGKIGVKVRFTTSYTSIPAVFVTPLNGSTYEVTDITTTGFTIRLSEVATANKSFTWMAAEIDEDADNNEQIEAPIAPIAQNVDEAQTSE